MNKALLLSVQAEYAEKILDGTKTVELRRRRPRVSAGDYLILYVPAPVKSIVGVVTVERVVEGRLSTLWRKVRVACSLTHAEFQRYLHGLVVGYAILVKNPGRLSSPLPLKLLRQVQPRFTPQGYRYLSRSDLAGVLGQLRVRRMAAM